MTDTNTNSTASESKAKTVAESMASRRVFSTPEEAAEYLTASAESFADFGDYPLAAPGIDESGQFDPAIYGEGTETMVAILRAERKVKAIVVAPVPTLDALLADENGRDWVQKIIHKELNHVAVRALREAEDVSTVTDQMPTTLDAYISGREGGAGVMEAYNEQYKQISALLTSKVPAWAKAKLSKNELKKALESTGYAMEYYPALEDRGEGRESLFVTFLKLGAAAAKKKGLDPAIFDRWAATRDAKVFTSDEESEDFDIDELTDSLLEEATEEAAAA